MKRTCLHKNTNTDEHNTCELHRVEIDVKELLFDPKGNQINKCFVQMKKIKFAALILIVTMTLAGCRYDDFVGDYDYTTVYFAYQSPVRTIYSNNLEIGIGVVLGCKIENKTDETVIFRVADELLNDATIMGTKKFTLLPSNYYTLSNANTIIIPEGEFVGKITLKLDESKFLSDPLSISNTYAIPVLITGSTTDKILVGDTEQGIARKDYTIIVIKYISQYAGVYYHRGSRKAFDASGNLKETLQYVKPSEEEIYLKDLVWNVTTIDANTVKCDGVAEFLTSGTNSYSLNLKIGSNNSVVIENNTTSKIKNIIDKGGSVFDKEKHKFYLNYEYTDAATSTRYVMSDTLNYRSSGLAIEFWN